MDSQDFIKESKVSLALITLSVIFITGTSLLSMGVLVEWFGKLPTPVYFGLPAAIFIVLSYLVVRYGYKKHTKAEGEKLKTILMLVGIILTCIPAAFVVNQYIWRAGVIDGMYPLSMYNATDIEISKVSTLHIWCVTISFLVFLCIAGVVWLYRTKLASLKGLLIVNIALLTLSLWAIQMFDSRGRGWYYGSEKVLEVLENNLEEYYAQIEKLDSICMAYNETVTRLYDRHLDSSLRDFCQGNQSPVPKDAPLIERHKRYEEMQSWLFDYVCKTNMSDSPNKKIWDECKESEEKVRKQIHATIDIHKIQEIQKTMDNIENNFLNMDYEQMDMGSVYKERVNMITSIAGDLNYIGESFISYMNPDASYPVYHDIDEITYWATDRLQSVRSRLSHYDEKFHHK